MFTTQNIMPFASIKDTRSLDVPHVEQTGVCGVAAWAAVLNYRFGTPIAHYGFLVGNGV